MTKLPRRNRNRTRGLLRFAAKLLACATALAATGSAKAGALIATEWSHRQPVDVAAPGLVRIVPTAATFDTAGPQQADLRILNPNGIELPYLLDCPPVPAPRIIRPTSFQTRLVGESTVITLTPGTEDALASVTLETPHPFFLRAARLEISRLGDGSDWLPVGEPGLPIFRQFGAEQLTLPLPAASSAALLRIIIDDHRAPAIPFTGAYLTVSAQPAAPLVPVATRIVRRDEFVGETVLTLALDGRHQPLAALTFSTTEPLFLRRVTLAVRDVREAVPSERVIGTGTIYRIALDGAPAREQLIVPFVFTPDTRELLVHIHNGDSPPLALDGAQFQRRPVSLLFRAPAAATYSLLSGNPQATAPRYDLAAFAGELRQADTATVSPGELTATPSYRPATSLAAAPLPDIPLTGALLDTADWPYRRALVLTQPGVQELELDPAALAHTQPDFADLRFLRSDHQIPYVLERPDLARSLPLTPVAVADPKRPGVSVWKLELPQPGLPLRRLVLTSATPLFERQFRLYEKSPRSDGRDHEILLASGAWRRTPEPGVSETRSFDLITRPRGQTLWLETDNGDNPAIALGAVQAVYPVVRLIFKTTETEGLALVYGNSQAAAPRYDLSLVAPKLLTAPRHVASFATPAENTAPTHFFANLQAGYLLWIVLSLVVIVLLVIVAKLLPKPPAA